MLVFLTYFFFSFWVYCEFILCGITFNFESGMIKVALQYLHLYLKKKFFMYVYGNMKVTSRDFYLNIYLYDTRCYSSWASFSLPSLTKKKKKLNKVYTFYFKVLFFFLMMVLVARFSRLSSETYYLN